MRKYFIAAIALAMLLSFSGCTNTRNRVRTTEVVRTPAATHTVRDRTIRGNVGTSPDAYSAMPDGRVVVTPTYRVDGAVRGRTLTPSVSYNLNK